MDKLLHNLIKIIHFTENVSAKVYGMLDEAEIYRAVIEEFVKSKQYDASILLLTDNGLKLRIAETSLSSKKVRKGGKNAGLKLKKQIDLNQSEIYSQVVKEGKTIQVKVSDTIDELFSQPLAALILKVADYEKRVSILTPLYRKGKITGIFSMDSMGPAEYFIPSVKALARHISNALELADELFKRKGAEEELREAKEKAKTANRGKSEFLACMSHELRTPLNAIIGFSEMLREKYFGELNEKQEQYVEDILASGKHLLSLINDILDLSKIDTGKTELELTDVKVGELLEGSVAIIRDRCIEQGIALDIKLSEEVDGLEVRADERKLKQVMFNLLSNAVKFTPHGGRIVVEANRDGEELRISVVDSGIGIGSADLEKIFEEFYQVQSGLKDKTPGTGLGLRLVRCLVEMHGGSVWAESDGEGRGSRFMVTMPLKPEFGELLKAEIERWYGVFKTRKRDLLRHLNGLISWSRRHQRIFTLCCFYVRGKSSETLAGRVANAVRVLAEEKRRYDILGIDEEGYIYLILPEIDREVSRAVYNRFMWKMKEMVEGVTVSSSISGFPSDGETPEKLLDNLKVSLK